jgi:5-methylcytosine-specific restriction endonuclease McrA
VNFDALMLTPWMQPHQIVAWPEAICALYLGKAEVLEEYAEKIRGPSISMNIPAVMRLKKPVTRVKRDVKFSRLNVYTRDDFRCQFCGAKRPARELTYDHVLPFSRGGKTDWENIVTACGRCNRKKGNRTPEEAGMQLLKRPARPKSLPLVRCFALPRVVPAQWQPYLGDALVAVATAG